MQIKRSKRSRNRAARKTAGHGSKKKNRGSGHRGGVGQSSSGKRGSAKLMKITKGKTWLGKHGFKSILKKQKAITLQEVQGKLASFMHEGIASKDSDMFSIDLGKAGYYKLLSKGEVSIKLSIRVPVATGNAVSKIEAAGGRIELSSEQKSEENK